MRHGIKFKISSADAFLMLISVPNHAGTWAFLENMFRIISQTFKRCVSTLLEVVEPHFFDYYFVTKVEKENPMRMLVEGGRVFTHHPFARYATYVKFQHKNRPMGNLHATKKN